MPGSSDGCTAFPSPAEIVMRDRSVRSWAAGVLILLSLSGCAGLMQTIQDISLATPTADITGVRLRELGLQSLTLEFDVAIGNPYAFNLPLIDFDFGLSTNGRPFLDGSTKVEGSVPSNGSKTIALPIRVDLLGLVKTIQFIRPGQVIPYEAEMGLNVHVSGTGPIRIPLRKSGEMPVPNVPSIQVSSLNWDQLSLTNVSGTLLLDVGNTNEFPFSLKSLGYDLSLANSSVANGQNHDGLELPAGENGALAIPLSFSPASAGLALLNVLRGDEADYSILGNMSVETPFGPMSIPYEKTGVAPLGQ
jgi:LEA14-like dessication related protein